MNTLKEIYERCYKDEATGCMIFKGYVGADGPKIYAPNPTTGVKSSQHGRRAVWQLHFGKALQKGFRVFSTCGNLACVNHEHIVARTPEYQGRLIAESGKRKGLASHVIANRKINRAKSVLTDEIIAEILSSNESEAVLAKRFGFSKSPIGRVRRGEVKTFPSAGAGFFSGLMK